MHTEFDLILNSKNLNSEFDWLKECYTKRISSTGSNFDFHSYPPPVLEEAGSSYATFVYEHSLTPAERLVLILSLTPFLDPGMLSEVMAEKYPNQLLARLDLHVSDHRAVVFPTANTALYLLAGLDKDQRLSHESVFAADSFLVKNKVIVLESSEGMLSWRNYILKTEEDHSDLMLKGSYSKPSYSLTFPAEEITTQAEEEDLILYEETREGIKQALNWIRYGKELYFLPHYSRKVKPGARVLFHGAPGTGKTESAALLGKQSGRIVYL